MPGSKPRRHSFVRSLHPRLRLRLRSQQRQHHQCAPTSLSWAAHSSGTSSPSYAAAIWPTPTRHQPDWIAKPTRSPRRVRTTTVNPLRATADDRALSHKEPQAERHTLGSSPSHKARRRTRRQRFRAHDGRQQHKRHTSHRRQRPAQGLCFIAQLKARRDGLLGDVLLAGAGDGGLLG